MRYVRPHAKGWLAILVLTLLATSMALLVPLPLKVLIDNVVGHSRPPAYVRVLPGSGDRHVLLIYVVVAELTFFALASALDMMLTFLWIKVGQRMVYDLAQDLFARVQRRSLRAHGRQPVGETLERVTGDSWVVYTVADQLLFTPLHAALAIAGFLFVMAELNLQLMLVACAVVPLMAIASFAWGRRIREPANQRRDAQGRLQSHVQQTLAGIGIVQAFGAEETQRRRFTELTRTALRSQLRMTIWGGLTGLGTGLLAAIGLAVIIGVGGQQVLAGSLTVGGLVIFLSYARSMQAQLAASTDSDQPAPQAGAAGSIETPGLLGIYTNLQSIRPSIARVLEVLDEPVEVGDSVGAVESGRVVGEVAFEGVWFGYEPGRAVLRGVDFRACPGEVVAVVGATGAGKSTLVSLVPRFFDPDAGRVLLDGRDVRDLRLSGVRESVSLVLQESFLFPFSIAENIAFGRPGAGRGEVEAAARAANAHDFICGLPEGYDTVVGERGATLSGGERQRVAIARALLKDAPVLVLDEPTSALDVQTESLLLDALDRLMAGRTTLIIAHRLSTIRHADQILVLDQGTIVEAGTHDQLLEQNGHYAHLHSGRRRAVAA